jgi:hypothetical protein
MGWMAMGVNKEIHPWVQQSAVPILIKRRQSNRAIPEGMSTQPE